MRRSSEFTWLVSGTILVVGLVLAIKGMFTPTISTAVACPKSVTHWQLFGVWIPNYHDVSVGSGTITWNDGCNTHTSYFWQAIPGLAVALVGLWVRRTDRFDA